MRSDIWKKVARIMSISDYFTFKLTGCRISVYGTSSMTGLFDVSECKWWVHALEIMNMEKESLSSPARTGSLIGNITEEGAELTGLAQGTPFVSGGLDHHMVAISIGLQDSECVSESTGTVLACVNYGKGLKCRTGLNVAPGLHDDFYFNLSFDANGALPLEWYQKKYSPHRSIVELLKSAEEVKPGSDGLIARPCAETCEDLKGFENISDTHSKAHFVRAILESTSLSLLKLIEKLDPAKSVKVIIPSGGGAQSSLWIQIKANMLNRTFLVPECSELACKGAAMTSLIGAYHLQDITGVKQEWVKFKSVVTPDPSHVEKYMEWYNNNFTKQR
jgi:sugar (pentulose or hexulose) kinase